MSRPLLAMVAAMLGVVASAAVAQDGTPQRAVLGQQAWGTHASGYVALDGERLPVRQALRQPLDAVRASLDTGVELRVGAQARLRLALHTGLTRQAPSQAFAITLAVPF